MTTKGFIQQETVTEWKKKGPNIRNSSIFNILKKNYSASLRPLANTIFKCHNPKGIKFLIKLSLELSHIRQYKFKRSS